MCGRYGETHHYDTKKGRSEFRAGKQQEGRERTRFIVHLDFPPREPTSSVLPCGVKDARIGGPVRGSLVVVERDVAGFEAGEEAGWGEEVEGHDETWGKGRSAYPGWKSRSEGAHRSCWGRGILDRARIGRRRRRRAKRQSRRRRGDEFGRGGGRCQSESNWTQIKISIDRPSERCGEN